MQNARGKAQERERKRKREREKERENEFVADRKCLRAHFYIATPNVARQPSNLQVSLLSIFATFLISGSHRCRATKKSLDGALSGSYMQATKERMREGMRERAGGFKHTFFPTIFIIARGFDVYCDTLRERGEEVVQGSKLLVVILTGNSQRANERNKLFALFESSPASALCTHELVSSLVLMVHVASSSSSSTELGWTRGKVLALYKERYIIRVPPSLSASHSGQLPAI